MLETLTSIRRAGAQIILTYWAVEAAAPPALTSVRVICGGCGIM